MGTRQVELDEGLLVLLDARRREGESLSDTIERLIPGPTYRDLAGILDEEGAEEVRKAIEESREAGLEKERRLFEKLDDD